MQACMDPRLFSPWFSNPDDWTAWFTFLRAVFGLPMSKEHREIYKECTERTDTPKDWFREVWVIAGRRGGKSQVLAIMAVYLSVFVDWQKYLNPGERGRIMCIATDRKQARVIFSYIEAFFRNVDMIRPMLIRPLQEELHLSNNINIEVHTATFRGIRGYTVVAALFDEIAFFRSEETANPDREILDALRPGMASIPKSMLFCASSPYAKRGVLYESFRDYYGKNDKETLVWKAPTRRMNPTIPQEWLDKQFQKDPAHAAAEYGAEFRTDVELFVPREVVEQCVEAGRFEQAPEAGVHYQAFVDPSGGSQDSMTLAIAHLENDAPVIDAMRERKPPFSPDDVVDEFCSLMKRYSISYVQGDRYAGEWPRERFRVHGVLYEVCKKTKSDIYREFLPLLMSKECTLLDNKIGIEQLCSLERRTARGGRDSIDHPIGAHDDVSNVIAGVCVDTVANKPLEIW